MVSPFPVECNTTFKVPLQCQQSKANISLKMQKKPKTKQTKKKTSTECEESLYPAKQKPHDVNVLRAEVQYLQNTRLKANYCTTLCYIYILTQKGLISREK